MIKYVKKFIFYFINFTKRFIFLGLNKFYLSIIIYLSILLGCNFILQDLKNRIYRLEAQKKVIMIDISNKEAQVANKIIQIMNESKGNNIQPTSIIKTSPIPKPKLKWYQKILKIFGKKY